MKVGFRVFFRLVRLTYFPGKNRQARPTIKRVMLMSAFLPVLLISQTLHWIGFLLDEIFFRGYRSIEIQRPLFIVGVPRSGTTFLHRLIAKDTDQFTTFSLWELLFAPSITEKVFFRAIHRIDGLVGHPMMWLLRRVESLSLGKFDDIHKTTLSDPEEDYLSLIPIFACFILVVPFPFFDELWHLAYFDERTPETDRHRVMQFYRRIIQRHLYVYGTDKHLLSKNPMFSPMIASLAESFPDCRIVCNLRNPYQAIPSLLSSMTDAAAVFDNDQCGTEFRDQFLDMLKFFYRYLSKRLRELEEERHAYVRFDDLTANPQQVVEGLFGRLGYQMSQQYAKQLQEQHQRSKSYRSLHKYSLDQFDLEPGMIYEELQDIYEEFQFNKSL